MVFTYIFMKRDDTLFISLKSGNYCSVVHIENTSHAKQLASYSASTAIVIFVDGFETVLNPACTRCRVICRSINIDDIECSTSGD